MLIFEEILFYVKQKVSLQIIPVLLLIAVFRQVSDATTGGVL